MVFVIITKHAKFTYSPIESEILSCAPPCGYKFHAFAVYLRSTFTSPLQSEAHLESSRTAAVELFYRNSRCPLVVGCFLRRALSSMCDRILNATLTNNLL